MAYCNTILPQRLKFIPRYIFETSPGSTIRAEAGITIDQLRGYSFS